jgi:hypothetical protein
MSLRSSSHNMAAPLSICTVEEQRSVIRFLCSECVKPSENYRRMKVLYGDSCLSQRTVYAGLWYPRSRVRSRPKPSEFFGRKISQHVFLRKGSKAPFAPCRRFAVCQRTLQPTMEFASYRLNYRAFPSQFHSSLTEDSYVA